MRCFGRLCLVLALAIPLSLLPACSGGGPGSVDDEDTDTTAPAAVTDLVATNATTTTADLAWTAPADTRDDGSGGIVDIYDLRWSAAPITAANFDQAAPVAGTPGPLPAGQRQALTVQGLTPGARCWFALRSCDDSGNWSALSDCPWVDCEAITTVTFADAALEQAVRAHVHKPTGDLTTTDVDTLHHLVAPALGIVSLEGLQACASLLTAQLRGNAIVDLGPLRDLDSLGGLYLDYNQVGDLQPLVGAPALRQLHLIGNPLTSLAPLPAFTLLEQVTLSEQSIADLSPLCALGHLRDLYLGVMELDDIDFAVCLWEVRNLNLEINHIASLEPLRLLADLEVLNLWQNDVVDLAPLTGLVKLREVNLGGNRIVDLQALVDNAGLGAGDVVRVSDNPLSAAAVAVQIPALEGRGVVVIR